ncbi:MAG: hypothetical protein ACI9E1_001603 [Cryomorphaceae bacterium]|jgi:hypothetical protein
MICIAGNMPVLQVGEHQISNYDTYWIRRAIENASIRANQPHFSFIDDVYDGIVYYLEHKCPLRLLAIESLYTRIRHTLKRIGCEAIANALEVECPPITISLERAATDAGNGYELAFYQILQAEMISLKQLGAREVFFSEMRESVMIMKQAEQWYDDCDQLESDILLWLKKAGTQPQRQGFRIRCNIEKIKV